MKKANSLKMFCLRVLVFGAGVTGAAALASAAPAFSIAATNVTMPTDGLGTSQYTITAIPLTGTIVLACAYAGTPTKAKVPICPMTPPVAYPVTAGGTLQGKVFFYSANGPVPVSVPGSAPAAGLMLTGAVLLGLRGWSGRRRQLVLVMFAAGALAGITACGGSSSSMTPGTYPYTITAINSPLTGEGPSFGASVTINVTVP